jgi:hypothetical protein
MEKKREDTRFIQDRLWGGAVGAAALGPKKQRPPSHWTLAFFVKPIYSRHKYVKNDALSSYRLVSFILLN